MIFLKTSRVKDIWEKDGIAGFNSYYTGTSIFSLEKNLPMFAIGFYTGYQDSKCISLLEIQKVERNSSSSNDIELKFKFIKKLKILSSDFENEISGYDKRYLFQIDNELVKTILQKFEKSIDNDIYKIIFSNNILEKLAIKIYEIIKDYRSEDGVRMSEDLVIKWINQFEEGDRIFILEELLQIFKKRYITKNNAEKILLEMIEELSKEFKYDKPKSFLSDCCFIDHQPDGKSQPDLLKLLDNIIQKKFNISLTDCGKSGKKYFVYLDDFLCTGDTLFKGLAKPDKGWLFKEFNGKSLLNKIKDGEVKIILTYFFIHRQNILKTLSRLNHNLKENIKSNIICFRYLEIDNNYIDTDSKLDFLFPVRENQSKRVMKFFKDLNVESDVGIFRNADYPKEEKFFSSRENRIRLESIFLKKGLELYDLAGSSRSNRMRPLGYGLASHKNFGFGTLCFSWRNVPFNVPMVFWYGYHDWIPLFVRKFVTYNS